MARFASLPEAAEYLRVSQRTLWRYRSRGVVPSHKVMGRVLFDLDELDVFVAVHADPRPAARTAEQYALASKREARSRRSVA